MSTDNHTASALLIDAAGRITYRLTLQSDGTVEVRGGHHALIVVDPSDRRCLTEGEVSEQVMDLAAGLVAR